MRFPFFGSKDKAPASAARPAVLGDDALVQAARTKARRRLVGALVLLLVGVVGFPLLFETQPRPLPVDIPMLVPEGTPARVAGPTAAPAAPAAVARPLPSLPPDAGTESGVAAVQIAAVASAPASAAVPAPQVATAAPASVAAAKPALTPALPSTPKPAAKPAPAPAVASAPAKPAPEPAAAVGRFVVQVGAYNDVERLKAARAKLEKLGFKSYTQDVESPTGKRTRVRVGPYASRQEAESAAAKVKAAGMQAAILSL